MCRIYSAKRYSISTVRYGTIREHEMRHGEGERASTLERETRVDDIQAHFIFRWVIVGVSNIGATLT